MKLIDVQQGTPAWHNIRAKCFTASEAPVMMNASSKMKRNELLHMKATGTAKEVCDWVQKNLFDKGHEYEAGARAITERNLGEDLYPATATDNDGWLLASYDGLTIDETTIFEHKMWNLALAAKVRAGELDPEYYWQLEQQLLIAGAERVIFVVSDGTEENRVEMIYTPVPGRAEELIAGWMQFEKTLKAYVQKTLTEYVPPPVERPETLAATIERFPALAVQLVGEVRQSNLPVVKASILDLIQSVNTELTTDQHFADAEATVKFFDKAEKELEVVKSQALSQTASIADLFDTIALLQDEMRKKRLFIDKLVKVRKETIRTEIRQAREKAFAAHVAEINQQIGPRITLPLIPTDFAGVMKNKRTIASLENAVDSELDRAKIEADKVARTIHTNLAVLRELADHQRSLFADAQSIITKAPEDFANLVSSRCAEAAEKERERVEQERERIRLEEEKKAREALAQQVREQEEAERREDAANAERLAQAKAPADPEPDVKPEPVAQPAADLPAAPEAPRYHTTGTASIASRIPARFELVNMDALLKDIVNGVMPMDLVQIVPAAVAEYIADNGCAPTGFTISGGRNG